MELTLAKLCLLALAGTTLVSAGGECRDVEPDRIVPLGQQGTFGFRDERYLPINVTNQLIDQRVALTCKIWTDSVTSVTVAVKFEDFCQEQSDGDYTESYAAEILHGASDVTTVDCEGRDGRDKLVTKNVANEKSIILNITVDSALCSLIKLAVSGSGNASVLCSAPLSSQGNEQTTATVSPLPDDVHSLTVSSLPDDVHTVTPTTPSDHGQGLNVAAIAWGAAVGAAVIAFLLVIACIKCRQSKRAAAAKPEDVLELQPASGGAPSASAAAAELANEDNGEYDHVGRQRTPRVATGDQTYGDLAPDGDVYNHLQRGGGATAVIKGDNLYGHLGEEDSAYDVTSRATRRPEQVNDVYSTGSSQ